MSEPTRGSLCGWESWSGHQQLVCERTGRNSERSLALTYNPSQNPSFLSDRCGAQEAWQRMCNPGGPQRENFVWVRGHREAGPARLSKLRQPLRTRSPLCTRFFRPTRPAPPKLFPALAFLPCEASQSDRAHPYLGRSLGPAVSGLTLCFLPGAPHNPLAVPLLPLLSGAAERPFSPT